VGVDPSREKEEEKREISDDTAQQSDPHLKPTSPSPVETVHNAAVVKHANE